MEETKYKYKSQQIISQNYTSANNNLSFHVNTNIAVDKIRISLSGIIGNTNSQPGLLVYSNIFNNFTTF